nr:uncharacterized protein LOC124217258 [Neodiprion pinetum]
MPLVQEQHDMLDEEITMEELIKSLKKSKCGKAPGMDNISNDFLKELPENWLYYIQVFFNKIIQTEIIPDDWAQVVMFMLHKKGDSSDPDNYRSIALINSIAKVFTNILHDRLRQWAENNKLTSEEQAGLCTGKGCADNVFLLQTIIQMQLRFPDITAYILFIDLRKAFDKHKLIRILINFYSKSRMHIRKDHHLSDPIDITEGVLQGDILSPLLFILLIADIIKFFENRDVEGLNLNNLRQILMLLYADDIAALSHSASSLKAALKVLEEYCDTNGLEVNISKTKIMACRTSGRIKKKDKGFQFKGKSIEVVKTYTYLGVAFSSNLQGDIAATEASKRGKQAIGSTYSILSRLRAETWLSKKKLHDSMIKTTLLYLVHIWGLRKEILDNLEAPHLLYFKRIFHLPVCTPHYFLRLELDIPHISLEVLKYAYNWVIKILEMREDRLPKLGLTRLIQPSANYKSQNLNWTLQVKSLLSLIGEEQMFEDMNATHWKVARRLAPNIPDKRLFPHNNN